MDIEQLRRILARLPGDMPVVFEDSQLGWMQNARLYIAPAHIDRRVSGNYLHALNRNDRENCHALLVSAFHQPNKIFADITPESDAPKIVDVDDHASTPRARRNPASQTQGHTRPRHRH
jgi:hypothetical protein